MVFQERKTSRSGVSGADTSLYGLGSGRKGGLRLQPEGEIPAILRQEVLGVFEKGVVWNGLLPRREEIVQKFCTE